MGDAVEVDTRLDPVELARDRRVEDELARPDATDLLRREGDEEERTDMAAAGKLLGDPAQPFDAGGVVDHARPSPDRVVVRGDDDRLLALAAQLRDHVSRHTARDEPAPDAHARARAI